jgi:hypothetical protein
MRGGPETFSRHLYFPRPHSRLRIVAIAYASLVARLTFVFPRARASPPFEQVATITLVALFVYDVFWVFFSAYFFADNVMVAVATKRADNPAQVKRHTPREPRESSMLPLSSVL